MVNILEFIFTIYYCLIHNNNISGCKAVIFGFL